MHPRPYIMYTLRLMTSKAPQVAEDQGIQSNSGASIHPVQWTRWAQNKNAQLVTTAMTREEFAQLAERPSCQSQRVVGADTQQRSDTQSSQVQIRTVICFMVMFSLAVVCNQARRKQKQSWRWKRQEMPVKCAVYLAWPTTVVNASCQIMHLSHLIWGSWPRRTPSGYGRNGMDEPWTSLRSSLQECRPLATLTPWGKVRSLLMQAPLASQPSSHRGTNVRTSDITSTLQAVHLHPRSNATHR